MIDKIVKLPVGNDRPVLPPNIDQGKLKIDQKNHSGQTKKIPDKEIAKKEK